MEKLEERHKSKLDKMQKQMDINRKIDEEKNKKILEKHEKEMAQIRNEYNENQKKHLNNLSELERERKKK